MYGGFSLLDHSLLLRRRLGSFGGESINAFSLATKTPNFENALVRTGPYYHTPREHNNPDSI